MADAAIDARAAKALDSALAGSVPADPGIARMIEAADALREKLAYEMPDFRAERAAFVQGVGSRARTWGWMRFFGPATVAAIALIVAVMLGRTALPGETLYPVRQALRAVGLAPFSLSEIDGEIHDAKQLLAQAEGLKNSDAEQARELAFEAVKVLGFAEEVLPDVDDRGNGREAQIKALLRRAQGILLTEPKQGRGNGRGLGVEKEPGVKNGPKDKPPGGNSGAVRNDGDKPERGNRSDRSDDHGNRTARDKRNDNRSDGSNKGPGSADDQGEDKEDVIGEDDSDDDFDDGNRGSGNDDKESKDKGKKKDDAASTPSPEETADELEQEIKDTIRKGHGKKSPDDDHEDDDGDDD